MAYATASGGTLPYIYSWNDSLLQTNDTAFNLFAGAYTITVRDSNNCFQTANTSITQPPALYNVMNTNNILIVGGNTGSATANPFGGTGSYDYSWNTGGLTQTINNLTTGVYAVIITDDNNCSIADSVLITEGACNDLSINAVTTNVACFGENSGSAFANVINAIAPYTINWSNGQTGLVATGLSAGNYSVTITDARNCSQFNLFTITQTSLLSSSLSSNDISCFGSNDGTIDLTITGGTFPYSFNWSHSSTNEDQINLKSGTYSVLITDKKGCTSNSSALISQPSFISAIHSVINVKCYNDSSGAIDLTVSGGIMPYTYHWSSNATTQDIAGVKAGGYYNTITDANNCKLIIDPIAVTQPDATLNASINQQTNAFCFGANTGAATVTATGGSGVYSYSWNTTPVQTTTTAINLTAGSYTVTVTDNNGCSVPVTKAVIITQPSSALSAGITQQTNVFCNGSNTGAATVTATGGSGAYSYSWNTTPVQTSATAINLTAGSYTITVTDNNGCVVPVSVVATITEPVSVLAADINQQTDVFCNGSNTGAATVTATGGSGAYSYSWNTTPVQTTTTAINLAAGSYTVIVTDNNGCTVLISAVATITEPVSVLAVGITQQTDVFCNGSNTGAATVTATGGSGAYSYSWNTTPVQTTTTAINLAAGSYTVTVTDNNGCTVPLSVVATITQPVSVLAAGINQQTDVFCNGSNTGTATVTASGGSGSYSYSWNTTPVQTTATANNLTAGSYTVTVTDNNGCTVPISAVATITQPVSVLAAGINQQTDVFCNGSNTGTATVTATGGSGSYSYSWNTTPVQTTATANNLTAGSYTVTVTDNNGCAIPVALVATITQPLSELTASITSESNVFCFEANTGAATVTATGGSGAYSYSWNTTPVQTATTAINLAAGSYTVTVTDNNGCTVPVSNAVTITQPSSALSAGITLQTNVFCTGGNTGSASVTASGGSGSYSYSWNTSPVQTTATANNLTAGSYTVTITDNNGCAIPVSLVATITEPVSVLTASITSESNVFCFEANTGTATVTASGGSGSYSYSWNTTPVQTATTAINLAAGSYTVTVTDNNGCAVPVSVIATITQPASILAASINQQTNVFCNGGNTGSATVTATGGSGSYSFLWNSTPLQIGSTAINLGAGSYTVSVTDNNGCAVPVTAVTTITQPVSILSASIIEHTDVFCFGCNTGSLTVSATGGSGDYSYSWSTTPVQTTATANNLTAGNYTVTVTDNNGCKVPITLVATIIEPGSVLNAGISSQTNVFCFGDNTGEATVTATGGSGSYSYSWNTIPVQTTATANNLTAGNYTVTVTDNNGSTISVTAIATITQPLSGLIADISSQTNVFCNNGNTGNATVTASGGSGSYSYLWNTIPLQIGATSVNLSAGSYTVTVTDNNGCAVPASNVVIITQPASSMDANITSNTNVFCSGGNTGSATVTATGGSGSYSYSWNTTPVQTTAIAYNLTAGSYTVTVTDNNGCSIPVTRMATITEPVSVLAASITSQTNVFCNGGNTGIAIATATGGSGSYTYSWNTTPVQTTATANNLTTGSYTVTVTDNNGCTVPVSAVSTITQPEAVLAASVTSQINVFCNGGNTGTATVTATGGSGNYSYLWNSTPLQIDATALNLSAGSYTVTVTDKNGCAIPVTTVAIITQPASSMDANITSSTNVYCSGGNTGSATVTATGGSGSYSYSWNTSPVQTTATADNLTAGSYTVTVTDNNGCSIPETAAVTITEPVSVLTANITSQTNVFCNGGSSGSATVTATGGSGAYSYSWNTTPEQTTATATNLPTGSYTVTVSDNNGCTFPVTKVASIIQPASALNASISSQTEVFCNGGNTGNATVTAIGGSGSYSYAWNTIPAQTTATAINLTAGNYTVTVSDNNGCAVPVVKIATIIQPSSALNANISSQTDVFCNGDNTGSVTVTATGGSGNYSYSWNTTPARTTATATGLLAGTYTVTVIDNNGCTVAITKVVTIAQPSSVLAASISAKTDVFCKQGMTGSATVIATGGSGFYSYSWNTNPVQTTATANNLTADSFTVTVSDNNGCTIPVTCVVTITQPVSVLAASISSKTNVFCNGANTGTAMVAATGGSGSYSYSWNTTPVQTTATANNLTAGTYTVTVTDNNGCSVPVVTELTITQPESVLSAGITSQTNVFCFGGNSGSATVQATGGSGSYLYSWNTNPVQTTATAIGLTMGTYIATVTDSNGCTVPLAKVVTITQPSSVMEAGISSQTNVFCSGGNTGSATVNASGGSGSYSYSWNTTPIQTAAIATGLTAGSYTVTITDNNGCVVPLIKTATIIEPATVLNASITSQTNVFCNGGNTGSAAVTASGGSGSYSYSWNTTPIQTTAIAAGLTAGSYTVTITDNNGCTIPVTKTVLVTQPLSVLEANITSQTNVYCQNGSTGSATVSATGGSGNYSYLWNTSPAQIGSTAVNLSSGSYTVTVTDNNGCTVPVANIATITQPSSGLNASITSQTNVFCNGGNSGIATITATGGSGFYTYLWNTTPTQTTATANNLSAGSYTATVTDNNGCIIPVTKVVTITQPSSIVEAGITSQTNVFCNGGNTGSATVSASGGSGSYSYSWSTNPAQTTATAIDLTAGSYTVTITDNNGCTIPVTKVAVITQPLLVLNASINSQTNVFCNGGNTGNATVTAMGGSGSYTYLWNTIPAQIGETAINLSAGSYTVFVTDNNGCLAPATAAVSITQPVSALTVNLSAQTNVFCFGGNTGTATITATGGSGAYSYSWNSTPVQTSATAIGLTASNYTVTITDNNGCAVPATVVATITQPTAALAATGISHTDLLCFGDSTGTATVTITGGSGVYLYSWNTTPVQTSATATGLTAGSYMVTVRDSNGCVIPALALTIIKEPVSALNTSVTSQSNVFCYGINTGSATVTATGGSGGYSYLWNTVPEQIGETAINLSAGSYTVTVIDNNGCSIPVTTELTITQPLSILKGTATSPFFNLSNISCNGGTDGTINLTVTGGTMPYDFSWTGPGTFVSATQNMNGLVAGLYTVNVTDANGCETSTSITLIEPSLMASTVGSTPADCMKSNGKADLDIIGGTQPYSFLWSCGITQQDLLSVPGGIYTVNVIDANGCLLIDTIKVDEISNLSLTSIVNDVLCYGFSDGSINLNVKGTAPFTYSWSNGSTTEDLTGVTAGQYIVIINDAE